MPKTRVLLVDDHTLVRQGLRRILESDPGIEIVGEAGNGRTAVELTAQLRPDVVVMDITLPELNGIEATRQITKRDANTRVLIVSMHADHASVRQSLKAGARGYVLKNAEDLELLKAVKVVYRGGSFFSPAVSKLVLVGYLGDTASRGFEDNLALLTGREREVLQLIAEGKTNKEIATDLSVSPNTVESHRQRMMERLDLHNTADLVRFAIRNKLVQ